MFRQLALLNAPPTPSLSQSAAKEAANRVLALHPIQLSRFLEEAWIARNKELRPLMPPGLEIPDLPQLGLERDSGLRSQIPQWIWAEGRPVQGEFQLFFTPPGSEPGSKPIPVNPLGAKAAAADVLSAFEKAGVGRGNVAVEGGPLAEGPIAIRFQGAFAAYDVPQLEIKEPSSSLKDEGNQYVNLRVGTKRDGYPPAVWDHLIYAYMVENTRVYEIFRRVLEECAYGERLGVPGGAAQQWLRTTEQLFYGDPPPFQVYSLSSWIRPDIRAVRRNAYQRMFGLDLNHGTDDGRPYPYPRATAANLEFSAKFEELLREVWRAIENVRNQVGANQTDLATISNLARAIYDMLRVRRQDDSGNLARDELLHVSTMSWFHLTLSFDTPIVRSLKAEATSPAERLQKVGERVGLPAHSRSDSYFKLAVDTSLILREMEQGTFNDSTSGAPALFQPSVDPANPNHFQAAMQEIIAHWTIATGRDLKSARVSVAPTAPTPTRPAPRPLVSPPSGNGHKPQTVETK